MRAETKNKNQISFHGCWLIFSVVFIWSYSLFVPVIDPNPQTKVPFWLWGFLGFAAFFISIMVHEAGHKIMFWIFKLPYPKKILFPFGDIICSQLDTIYSEPILLIAIAGPAANLLLAAILNIICLFLPSQVINISIIAILKTTIALNLLTASINLIPCKPFDGGLFSCYASNGKGMHCFKSLTTLSKYIPIISIFTGLMFLYQGRLFKGIWCILCGFIVKESQVSIFNSILLPQIQSLPVAHIMRKNPVTVQSNTTLKDFVKNYPFRFNAGIFPVFTGYKLQGYIDFSSIKRVPEQLWNNYTVADLSEKCSDKNTVTPSTEIIEVIRFMVESANQKLLVLQYGELCGVISVKDLSDFFYRCICTEIKHCTKSNRDTMVVPDSIGINF